MKTAQDPRHQKRIHLMQQLFTLSFPPASRRKSELDKDISGILKKLGKIDQKITLAAPSWPISQINKIDLAILRLSIFELLLNKEPVKVIIDEAIELAKQYGSEGSPGFINGVLGKIVQPEGKTNAQSN